jgi:hypothetical protein
MEQLQARQYELEEAHRRMEEEHAQLEREIARHHAKGGHARAMARDIHRRIVEDDSGLP